LGSTLKEICKMLSQGTKNRIVESLTSVDSGNQLIGAVGLYGGFRVNGSGIVTTSTGDVSAAADSGGAVGTYRVFFPAVNAEIQSLDWVNVDGFTPRAPTGVETCTALVTGFNYDTSLNQWYITVQIVLLSDYAVTATPPNGFTIGVRASVTLKPTANRL
jgi:hypothetical protein